MELTFGNTQCHIDLITSEIKDNQQLITQIPLLNLINKPSLLITLLTKYS